MSLREEVKTLPFGDIWNEYCRRQNVPAENEWFPLLKQYEKDVMSKRV